MNPKIQIEDPNGSIRAALQRPIVERRKPKVKPFNEVVPVQLKRVPTRGKLRCPWVEEPG